MADLLTLVDAKGFTTASHRDKLSALREVDRVNLSFPITIYDWYGFNPNRPTPAKTWVWHRRSEWR